jgi:hypothetical protein
VDADEAEAVFAKYLDAAYKRGVTLGGGIGEGDSLRASDLPA